ncbi:MAG TPA: GGDEF domain-containing protein [Anaerolineales bacterium]|jgi:diguanylate cyclase (GGDEF)-like protein|nr:GGDEF domain-containing protein [Anaerolineales bacterium]
MFKRLFSQVLIDLRELEGDYRVFNLQVDKAQSIISMIIAAVSVFGLLVVDAMLFQQRPDLFRWMLIYRGGFVLFTAAVIYAIVKVDKVRVFDRLILGWLSVTLLYLLTSNFTRPANYLTTTFDIIIIFAIYVLSPLKFQTNAILTLGFSIGTLYIDHFLKTGVDTISLEVATAAQLIVHLLGFGSASQLQTYRRKSFKAFMEERDAKEMVAYLANIDPLTKSLTRRHFFNIAESEFLRFARYRRPLSVLVIDVDDFKRVNDMHGHHAGDIVLRSFSLVALEQKRAQDTFGRLGGEEFGLILPETTLEQAKVVAERIQKMWEGTPSNLDGLMIQSTVSVGVAEAQAADKAFDDILRRADLRMYKAKEQGRNQVVSK